jgi:hypothetical protein
MPPSEEAARKFTDAVMGLCQSRGLESPQSVAFLAAWFRIVAMFPDVLLPTVMESWPDHATGEPMGPVMSLAIAWSLGGVSLTIETREDGRYDWTFMGKRAGSEDDCSDEPVRELPTEVLLYCQHFIREKSTL